MPASCADTFEHAQDVTRQADMSADLRAGGLTQRNMLGWTAKRRRVSAYSTPSIRNLKCKTLRERKILEKCEPRTKAGQFVSKSITFVRESHDATKESSRRGTCFGVPCIPPSLYLFYLTATHRRVHAYSSDRWSNRSEPYRSKSFEGLRRRARVCTMNLMCTARCIRTNCRFLYVCKE